MISKTIENQGYPPSLREIARYFEMVGTRAVEKHLIALDKKGFIRRGKGARAVEDYRKGHCTFSLRRMSQNSGR